MREFVRLYDDLDASSSTNDKVRALEAYFARAQPRDAAWAAWILTGGRIKRAAGSADLRAALATYTGLAPWLIQESYQHVGDLSETIALLLESAGADSRATVVDAMPRASEHSLAEVFDQIIVPMQRMTKSERVAALIKAWSSLAAEHRFAFQKLISGSFRVGVSRTLAVRALANVCDVPQSEVAHRVMGSWKPTAGEFARITAKGSEPSGANIRPYPFFLASPLEPQPEALDALGEVGNWLIEWKWDGIRAQVLRRRNETIIWSRGEELLTQQFSDLVNVFDDVPEGTVVDGEIVAWDSELGMPRPFQELQSRINRTSQPKYHELLFVDVPVRFIAYDLLEENSVDLRSMPLTERRHRLLQLIETMKLPPQRVGISDMVHVATWGEALALRGTARDRGVEGLMLKHIDSRYGTGRERGSWWKWKVQPFTLDVVLVAAQPGHGRRSGIFTDYTFAIWSDDKATEKRGGRELVTIAKAYSGLTDVEIDRVDAFVRRHTIAKFGPVRSVEPLMVFELAFDSLQESARHKAGIALRFPRIARIRDDKPVDDADTVATARLLLAK